MCHGSNAVNALWLEGANASWPGTAKVSRVEGCKCTMARMLQTCCAPKAENVLGPEACECVAGRMLPMCFDSNPVGVL